PINGVTPVNLLQTVTLELIPLLFSRSHLGRLFGLKLPQTLLQLKRRRNLLLLFGIHKYMEANSGQTQPLERLKLLLVEPSLPPKSVTLTKIWCTWPKILDWLESTWITKNVCISSCHRAR
ncbi:hypothetical protein HDU99_007772, partial [Rhizoclosmatium hyalinum]